MKKIIILEILLASLIVLGWWCITNNKHPEQEIIKNENVNLAIYLENEQTTSIPSKDSGYYFDREKSSCTNDAYINWDSVTWSPVILNAENYPVRCEFHFTTTYTEGILNGTDPVLKDELVPITIQNDGTVKKADLESEWYSYANKNWANAVILEDQYDSLYIQGKVQGATKQDGYVSFDGVDDYIDLGLENYEFTNGVTLAINFSINELNDTSYNRLIGNWEQAGLGLHVLDNQKIRFDAHNGSEYVAVDSANPINLGESYTAIGTYDGQNIKLFLNGVLVASLNASFEIATSLKPFSLAANLNTTTHTDFANIDVKNVQIYNRAISEEEVAVVGEGKVANAEGLLRYVDFTNKSYENNEIIPEEKIESYFVWIPKYRYQLWDLGMYDSLTSIDTSKVHEIPVIFGDYNTNDNVEGECTTPMESGATGNCSVGDYMTHPAFLSIPSKGFWVGKFETGYAGANNNGEAKANTIEPNKIIVKPNVYSWRGIQVSNAFSTSYDYKRNLDSHMMKNTEWGAVAYLQHSKYGSKTSVRLNNNSDYGVGNQAINEPSCQYTDTMQECNIYCADNSCYINYSQSVLASTTNNITGIYDMAGGAWEYVMAVIVDENGNPLSGRNSLENSGFNGPFGCPTCDGDSSGLTSLTNGLNFPDKKYFDKYSPYENGQKYSRRILGDATGEMGPFTTGDNLYTSTGSWYDDIAYFIYNSNSWFRRGGFFHDGLGAGIFAFTNNRGHAMSPSAFRLILTPT